MSKKKGVLLCNIGTPDSYEVKDVARYLREFLMDEDILTLPLIPRWFLVNALIVPRRAHISAENYKAIWTEQGSPLRVLSDRLKQNMQELLGPTFEVQVGMRYGRPSIEEALQNFQNEGVEEVLLLPLYPQFARATTVSSRKKLFAEMKKQNWQQIVKEIPPFYADPGFIQAKVEEVQKAVQGRKVDHFLMTYHGLPESQVKQNEGCLKSASCCERTAACAMNCYRAQCLKTSEMIAAGLGLRTEQYSTSFQSRLGKTEWIKPYTDDLLKSLPQNGVKHLAVLCPSFVSDCLETLEEIGVQGAKTFRAAGGEGFYLVPCLNERADYLARLVSSCL